MIMPLGEMKVSPRDGVNATDGGKCANGVRQSALKAKPTSRTRFTIQSNGMSDSASSA